MHGSSTLQKKAFYSILILFQVMRNLPEKHQTLLFSATMPLEIETLAQVRSPTNLLILLQAFYKLCKEGKVVIFY